MGPKYQSEGEDEHDGKWEYAGDPEFGWKTWKDHSNNQGEDGLGKSLFKYRDETPESISATSEFPEVGYQENPEKE